MNEFFGGILEIISATYMWRFILQDTWMILLLVTALIWGGGPEKMVIIIWIIVHEVVRFLQNYVDGLNMTFEEEFAGANLVHLTGDSLLLVGFVTLALQANRRYILWIAAFQVIAIMAHGVRALNEEMTIFVYLLMVYGAGWAQIFLMTGGQIAHIRRKKGIYADWRWQVAPPSRPASAQAVS